MIKVICSVCHKEVYPCPAKFDGEPTFVGYYPCPDHPGKGIEVELEAITVE